MAIAMPSPARMVTIATRWALRPPSANAASTPTNGTSTASTSRSPPGVVVICGNYASAALPSTDRRRRIGGERGRARHVVEAKQQCDRERARGKRDDEAGDQQRLRHRVAAPAGPGAAVRNGAEQHEHAVADHVERDDLAQ